MHFWKKKSFGFWACWREKIMKCQFFFSMGIILLRRRSLSTKQYSESCVMMFLCFRTWTGISKIHETVQEKRQRENKARNIWRFVCVPKETASGRIIVNNFFHLNCYSLSITSITRFHSVTSSHCALSRDLNVWRLSVILQIHHHIYTIYAVPWKLLNYCLHVVLTAIKFLGNKAAL